MCLLSLRGTTCHVLSLSSVLSHPLSSSFYISSSPFISHYLIRARDRVTMVGSRVGILSPCQHFLVRAFFTFYCQLTITALFTLLSVNTSEVTSQVSLLSPQSLLAAIKARPVVNISRLAFYQQSTKLEVFPHELTKNNIPAYFHAVMQ